MSGDTSDELKKIREDDLIDRIRSVKRYEPALKLRLRVTLAAALGKPVLSRSRDAERGAYPRFERGSRGRLAAACAVCVALAFLVFSSLVLASGSSLPGQPLYGLKRAREKLGLALTLGASGRAERHLALASNRLSELDRLTSTGAAEPGDIEGIARDYNSNTAAVARMLASEPASPGAKAIAMELRAIQTQKSNMVRRLCAESPSGVLAGAGGAKVSVVDAGATGVLGAAGRVSGTTDEAGEFPLVVDVKDRAQAALLDAVVEADGRKSVIPVFATAEGNEKYTVEVAPGMQAAALNRLVTFTVNVSRKNGSNIGQRRIRLFDRSRTCLIDGQRSEAVTWTDRNGAGTFVFVKTSADAVSRIFLQVEEGSWVDAGQILAVGAVEGPALSTTSRAVAATTSGSPSNPTGVELDNRIVRVSARKSPDGEILKSVAPAGRTGEAGPLYEPMVPESRTVGGTVSVDGPRVSRSTEKAASYEIAFTMTVNGGSIKKSYEVALAAGDCFATVRCNVVVSGDASEFVRAHPSLLAPGVLERPSGSTLEINGRKPEETPERDRVTLFAFQVGNPLIAFHTGNSVVFAAYAIDSGSFPDTWSVSAGGVSAVTEAPGVVARGRESVMLVGVTDRKGLQTAIARARGGTEDSTALVPETPGGSAEGFTVIATPGIEQMAKGKQALTLHVLKRYEQVFQKFQ